MKLVGVLRHPAEPRVLLLRSDRSWRLPRVVAEDVWIAQADAIGDAFERRIGTRPWLLRQLRFGEDEAVVELELADVSWGRPAHGRWAARNDLDGLRLKDDERSLLDGYLDALERDDVPPERPPWARPGWLGGVREWLEREASSLGHTVLAIEQVKTWSISAVLRVRTDGPTLYFKVSAPLPLFVDEAALTTDLAARFPGYVPAPLAVEAERGWLLLAEFDELVGWQAPLETRCELFSRFAGLQRRSVPAVDDLLAAGCLDRRLHVLEGQLDPLFADPVAVGRLTPEETSELRRLAPKLRWACRRLDALGLPATLVHGDLHPGNVARIDGELAYFDWTDACIAHPLIDLHSLQWLDDESVRAALLDAYLVAWDGAVSAEAVELARIVTPLHHAVSYSTIVANVEWSGQAELDATHGFLREALARIRDWPDG